ncbi:hypothetical protein [Streptomyces subrutilus]|uniref:hypothetical protein n=1 Tax=Streptomyces subrutilus TaxID=36818 RepID=UPI0033D9A84E
MARNTDIHGPRLDRIRSLFAIGDAGLEVSDAAVLEAEVGTGGLEPLVERSGVGRELTDPLLECGVLGGDALDGSLLPLGLQVPDPADEFTGAGPVGDDLAVSRFEGVLGVQGALAPDRLALHVLVGEQLSPSVSGFGHRGGDDGSRLGIVVEEGARRPRDAQRRRR